MPLLRTFITVFIILFVCSQCNYKQNDELIQSSSDINITPVINPLYGDWQLFKDNIWYSASITLNEDGTFYYESQGCYGKGFSKGNWSQTYQTISLTSFDSLKPKITEAIPEIEQTLKPDDSIGRDTHIRFVPVETKIPDLFADNPLYFENIQLLFVNDTLYCIDTDSRLSNSKFYKRYKTKEPTL